MKTSSALVAAGLLLPVTSFARAGEKVTLLAEGEVGQYGYSDVITLNPGESAELKYYGMYNNTTVVPTRVVAIAGKDFEYSIQTYNSNLERPLCVAGPAALKLRIGGPGFGKSVACATLDVNRVGTASEPVPIPQEPGTTWQVILEASSDLVNWTAVAPGDYPSSTPQRYFRTRIVKRT